MDALPTPTDPEAAWGIAHRLKNMFLLMATWGTKDFARACDDDDRVAFAAHIEKDTLFEYLEETKQELLCLGVPLPDRVLSTLATDTGAPASAAWDALLPTLSRLEAVMRNYEQGQPPASTDSKLAFIEGGYTLDGREFALSGKPLKVLKELASWPQGRSSKDLRYAVWPDSITSDETIRSAISTARKSLKEATNTKEDPIPNVERGASGEAAWRLNLP